MQLYAVNIITLLGSLYMFRVFYIPIIRSAIFNCIYSHWYSVYTAHNGYTSQYQATLGVSS